MLAPERRTRADLYAAVAIVVVVVIAVVVVWANSAARGTESDPAAHPASPAPAADRLPETLTERWHAPDGAASRALTSSGVAVTGDGGTVSGLDPADGHQVWRYRRDIPLCAVESQFATAIATYRDSRGCSQTTMLDTADGKRRTARSSYMDSRLQLSTDGTYMVAQGPDRLEVWRSDLVRTLEYGHVDAPVNPRTQPRQGCRLLSATSGGSRLAVLERCPDDVADRLTVLNPAPKDASAPEEYGSHVLTEPGAADEKARVIAASDNRIVLYLPGNDIAPPEFAVYDTAANPIATHRLTAPLAENSTVTRLGSDYFVFTGNSVIALNATTFEPQWTASDASGSPAMMAGAILVPVTDGIEALDPSTGAARKRIPLHRSDYHGEPISLAVSGTVVLEQRGGRLYGTS
ncbi:PQQ-binding-like beta-propeller repeat protein [Nocardia sp. NPDC052254]|uniref:Rv3212 family protein n=1 Tax=Nocardia sp. NPDC052254 TaxID=3155681 RepID=UPI00343CF785